MALLIRSADAGRLRLVRGVCDSVIKYGDHDISAGAAGKSKLIIEEGHLRLVYQRPTSWRPNSAADVSAADIT